MNSDESLFGSGPRSPGEYLRDQLDARRWTQDELASITNRSRQHINDIIAGRRGITAEMAYALGAAFGTTPEFWMDLDARYQLSKVNDDTGEVENKAKLYELAPIKEMQKRGWIESSSDLGVVESELKRFFDVSTLDQPPAFPVAMRKSAPLENVNAVQRAWCFRARSLAKTVHAEKFRPELLPHCRDRLKELAAFPDSISQVPTVLAGYGIRYVVVEPLTGAKIDGAAFWLDETHPVIAMAVRFDRIDAFWFTLGHEFAHILNGDASVDTDLVGEAALPTEAKAEIERRADEQAAAMFIPPDKLESFILRVGPLYSKTRINQFAHRMGVHPGIIVGQLQHRGELSWSSNRDVLAKVRSTITKTALTDGYGHSVPKV